MMSKDLAKLPAQFCDRFHVVQAENGAIISVGWRSLDNDEWSYAFFMPRAVLKQLKDFLNGSPHIDGEVP